MNIYNPELQSFDPYILQFQNRQCFFDRCGTETKHVFSFQGDEKKSKKLFNNRVLYDKNTKSNYIFSCENHYDALSLIGLMMMIHGGVNRNMISGVQKLGLYNLSVLYEYYIFCGIIRKFLDVDINDKMQVETLITNFQLIIKEYLHVDMRINNIPFIKRVKDEFKFFIFPLPFDQSMERIYNIANLFYKCIIKLTKKNK